MMQNSESPASTTNQAQEGDKLKAKTEESNDPDKDQTRKGDETKERINWEDVKKFVNDEGIRQAECVSYLNCVEETNSKGTNNSKKNEGGDESNCVKHGLNDKDHKNCLSTSPTGDKCSTTLEPTKYYGEINKSPFMRLWWKGHEDEKEREMENENEKKKDRGKEKEKEMNNKKEEMEYKREETRKTESRTSTEPSVVYELLTKQWKIKEPQLVVSVIGDINPDVPDKLQKAFQDDIETLLKTQDTWILTDGKNSGIAKLVGKAVERLNRKEKVSAVAIGVAHWGTNRSIEFKGHVDAKETGAPILQGTVKGGDALNHLHTHYILIDDAQYKESTTAAEFLVEFQKYISTYESARGFIETTSVVFGGRELSEILEVIKNGISLVAIKESKGATDIIPYVCGFSQNIPREAVNDDTTWKSVRNVKDNKPNGKKKRGEMTQPPNWKFEQSVLDKVKEEIKHNEDLKKQVQFCVLDEEPKDEETKGLKAAVLKAAITWGSGRQALPDSPKDAVKKILDHQINLSLSLNESQTARRHIFSKDSWFKMSRTLTEDDHKKKLKKALVNNLPDFVQLFLDAKYKYCNLSEFRENDIDELYTTMLDTENTDTKTDEAMVSLIMKMIGEGCCQKCKPSQQDQNAGDNCDKLHRVGRIISELVGPHYELNGIYKVGRNQCEDCCCCLPTTSKSSDIKQVKIDVGTHFFLWAVLFNRMQMAYFFWKQGNDDLRRGQECAEDKTKPEIMRHPHILMALMASTMLAQLAKRAHDRKEPDLHESLTAHAKLFEVRASDVLMECTADDRHKTQDLLTREHSRTIWGEGTTLLSAAYTGERKHFLERMPCRVKLDAVWRGKMVWSTPWWKVFLTTIFPFLIPLIKFAHNKRPGTVIRKMLVGDTPKIDQDSKVDGHKTHGFTSSRSKKIVYHVGRKKTETSVHFISAWLYFYSAPITKYYGCTLSYLVFLGLFSHTCLTNLNPGSPSLLECIVWAWILLFGIEEWRQILDSSVGHMGHNGSYTFAKFAKDFQIWMNDNWNIFDGFLYFILSPVCLGLRLELKREQDFLHARNAFAITLACFFFRFLQTFYAFKEIGSKVVIIFHMMKDLFKFGLILFVFILSYGMAITIIMYPNRPVSLDLPRYIFYSPYWQIFVRDAFVDKVDGEDGTGKCSGNLTNKFNGSNELLCRVDNKFGDTLLVVYTMFTNVLLLNVLIAMFNSTFERFQKDSTTWWHYNRYSMVYEYVHRPRLAPPFIILSYIHRLFRKMIKLCGCGGKCYEESSALCTFSRVYDYDELTDFERINMEKCMERQEKEIEVKQWLEKCGVTQKQTGVDDDGDDDESYVKKQSQLAATMILKETILETMSKTMVNTIMPKQLTTEQENLNKHDKPAQIATDRFDEIDKKLKGLAGGLESLRELLICERNMQVMEYEKQLRKSERQEDGKVELAHDRLSCCRIRTDPDAPGGVSHIPINVPRRKYRENEN